MIIGFTGTRNGLSEHQRQRLEQTLESLDVVEAHHGDCIGADAEFHDLCERHNLSIVVHPPSNNSCRANKRGDRVTILAEKPYLKRNQDIVDACDTLIACPSEATEQLRSGTWATVRYARKRNKIVLILPRTE